MKKIVLGLTALTLALIVPLTVLAQQGANGPGQNRIKTETLIAVNRAGLSLEQLQMLQGLVQGTLDARSGITDAQTALQTFLVNWSGTQADFDAALKIEQQKVKDAADALHSLMSQNVKTVKDSLTASQFDALERSLRGVLGHDNAPNVRDGRPGGQVGPDNNRGPNNGPQNQQGNNAPPSKPGLNRHGPAGQGNTLNVLLDVLNAKIDAINNAA